MVDTTSVPASTYRAAAVAVAAAEDQLAAAVAFERQGPLVAVIRDVAGNTQRAAAGEDDGQTPARNLHRAADRLRTAA